MKLIPIFFLVGMLAVSGWAEFVDRYSPELVKKAESGDATAQWHLGVAYENGMNGVAEDYKEALKWYTKSAEQGNASAQELLGSRYSMGSIVGKDEKEAVKWYTKSAEQGKASAQRSLGDCYEGGYGVGKDMK